MEEGCFGDVERLAGRTNEVLFVVLLVHRLVVGWNLQSITEERGRGVRADSGVHAEISASACLESFVLFGQFKTGSFLTLARSLDSCESIVALALFTSLSDDLDTENATELRRPALHSTVAHNVRDKATVALHLHELKKERVTRQRLRSTGNS